MEPQLVVENAFYRLEIEPEFGRLTRILDKQAGLELITEPRLGDNFRLLLPMPDYECNYILGARQKLTSHEPLPGGCRLFWRGPLQNERGSFDLDVTLFIELVDQAIRFRCEVRNGTPFTLSEIWFAMLGGMTGLGKSPEERRDTSVLAGGFFTQKIFTDFGMKGELLGCPGGEYSFSYPGFMSMPWLSFYQPALKRAVYFAALEETPRIKIIRLALEPGLAIGRAGGNWPRPDEVGDAPLGLVVNWTHTPFTKPGDTFVSCPVYLQCHDGGWQESGAIYRQWFDAHFSVPKAGSTWFRQETAFHDLMFMLPEDNINLLFKDIPGWAKTARDAGLRHVMISGWQIGGHDRGYPYYVPDPRLGTWEELEAGVRACHELGLRVSFFVNCQPVDLTTDWYKKELHRYRVLDSHGEPYFVINYWGMGTLSARTRFFTATPFGEINPAHPEVRDLLIRQFRRLVEIGADGLHIDKFFQTPMDFNPLLKGTNPDRAMHEGCIKFMQELLAVGRAINPEFALSYEGCWDRLMPYAEAGWWTSSDIFRTVFPERVGSASVQQPYDFVAFNRIVLQGDHVLVGPANYTRGLDYPPSRKLCEYGAEITRIRQELLEFVSLGQRIDASEGLLKKAEPTLQVGDPFISAANAAWAVFRHRTHGKRAIILANNGPGLLHAPGITLAGNPTGPCRVYQPFQKMRTTRFPVALDLPPERVAFVVEK